MDTQSGKVFQWAEEKPEWAWTLGNPPDRVLLTDPVWEEEAALG